MRFKFRRVSESVDVSGVGQLEPFIKGFDFVPSISGRLNFFAQADRETMAEYSQYPEFHSGYVRFTVDFFSFDEKKHTWTVPDTSYFYIPVWTPVENGKVISGIQLGYCFDAYADPQGYCDDFELNDYYDNPLAFQDDVKKFAKQMVDGYWDAYGDDCHITSGSAIKY